MSVSIIQGTYFLFETRKDGHELLCVRGTLQGIKEYLLDLQTVESVLHAHKNERELSKTAG